MIHHDTWLIQSYKFCCSNNACCNVGILASGPANLQGAVGHMSRNSDIKLLFTLYLRGKQLCSKTSAVVFTPKASEQVFQLYISFWVSKYIENNIHPSQNEGHMINPMTVIIIGWPSTFMFPPQTAVMNK